MSDDPFAHEGPNDKTHPELKRCETCNELLIWDVWTSRAGARCKAWRCPSKTNGHTTEFI